MSTIAELHDEAMRLADDAFLAKLHGEQEQAVGWFRLALDQERQAAEQLATSYDAEPTRSILFRSAATLAIHSGELRQAEQLIEMALAGDPPDQLREELRDLSLQVELKLRLESKGAAPSLHGPHIAPSGEERASETARGNEITRRRHTARRISKSQFLSWFAERGNSLTERLRRRLRYFFYLDAPWASSTNVDIGLRGNAEHGRKLGNARIRLHHIAGPIDDARAGDIVFVHGLGGDWRRTWTNADGELWPKWFAERDAPIGVWVVQQSASPSDWFGRTISLSNRATELLDEITSNGVLGQKPIVFVAHSLGGIVVKRLLRHSAHRPNTDYHRLCELTSGVAFLSTPHTDAQLASKLWFFRLFLRLTTSLDELREYEANLQDLMNWYRHSASQLGIRTTSFYETFRVWPFGIIVSRQSADPGIPGVDPCPVLANHLTISRIPNRNHIMFRRLVGMITACLRVAPPISDPNERYVLDRPGARALYDPAMLRFSSALGTVDWHRSHPDRNLATGQTAEGAASKAAEEAVTIALRLHDMQAIAVAYLASAECALDQERFEIAAEFASQSLRYARRASDKRTEVNAMMIAAQIPFGPEFGDLKQLNTLADLGRTVQDVRQQAHLWRTIGWIGVQRQLDIASYAAKELRCRADSLGDEVLVASACEIAGQVRLHHGDTGGAVKALADARSRYADRGLQTGECSCIGWTGVTLCRRGDLRTGLISIEQALAMDRFTLESKEGVAKWLHESGAIFLRLGEFHKAIPLLIGASTLRRQLNHALIADTDTLLASAGAAMGVAQFAKVCSDYDTSKMEWSEFLERVCQISAHRRDYIRISTYEA